MLIKLIYLKNSPNAHLINKAADLINFCQSDLFIKKVPVDSLGELEEFEFIAYGSALEAAKKMSPEGGCIYVSDLPFDNNFFAVTDANHSVLTTESWDELFAPPSLVSFLLRRICICYLCFNADVTAENIIRLFREDTSGCIFDFCINKADIKFSLRAGYLSPQTQGCLAQYGVPEQCFHPARNILEMMRLQAIGRSPEIEISQVFIVMRFEDSGEHAEAYRSGIRPAIEKFGMVPLRADEDPRMQQISDQVIRHIRKSRLILIFIDKPNPNVYFELGYALAANKDILIVVSESVFSDLPTDIQGWEVIIYKTGKIQELKFEIVRYLSNILPYRDV